MHTMRLIRLFKDVCGLTMRHDSTVTVTSSDPHFATPAVKAMMQRKNRLMHSGRTDEANVLAARLHKVIVREEYYLAAQTEHKKKR